MNKMFLANWSKTEILSLSKGQTVELNAAYFMQLILLTLVFTGKF